MVENAVDVIVLFGLAVTLMVIVGLITMLMAYSSDDPEKK